MSQKILISYANETYSKAQRLLTKTAKHAGFSKVIEYGPNDIDEEFRKENSVILSQKRGNGLWLWKPYFIKKTLDNANPSDIVFYCDSGACFFRSAKHIFEKLKEQDIWVSVLPLKEKQFTKRKAFELLDCDSPDYRESGQISGSFCAFKKSAFSLFFVNEWLRWCCTPEVIIPPENRDNEYPFFYAHREDQSILSLLVKKNHLMYYSDPSQRGKLPEKYIVKGCEFVYYGRKKGWLDYPVCILHHRTCNGNKKVLLNQLMCAILPRTIGLLFIKKNDE